MKVTSRERGEEIISRRKQVIFSHKRAEKNRSSRDSLRGSSRDRQVNATQRSEGGTRGKAKKNDFEREKKRRQEQGENHTYMKED